jgi:hypothetical protein
MFRDICGACVTPSFFYFLAQIWFRIICDIRKIIVENSPLVNAGKYKWRFLERRILDCESGSWLILILRLGTCPAWKWAVFPMLRMYVLSPSAGSRPIV